MKHSSIVKKSAVTALSLGVVAGLSLGMAPGANAAGEKIAFIQGVMGDGFYITMGCGVNAQAKKMGATVTTNGPAKFDATLQKPILEAVVATNPDAILIAPNDKVAMQKPLEAAAKKGIKIVLVDTTVNNPSFAVSEISSNNYKGGQQAFAAIAQLAPQGGPVLAMGVKPGISTTDERDRGFAEAVAASGGKYTLVSQEYSLNEPAVAAQLTTAAIAKTPGLVGVFASNLFSAEGVATGVKQAGKEGQIKVVSFDAGPDQVKALKAGTVQALIAQQPYQIGVAGVQQAMYALTGKKTTKKITTGFTIITQANVDTPLGKAAQYRAKC